ncbi:hypothetical protein E3G69_003177 [Mycobacteroides abscessus]|nr:hypothetical protein [Mycobacteroides abscessus]QOF44128.1 hypothetical protein E3G69_003177 [Mycobacteroides abscessus]QOF48827.1 hypothetical protein E3G70_003176 [Mycobacteroides abscessus]
MTSRTANQETAGLALNRVILGFFRTFTGLTGQLTKVSLLNRGEPTYDCESSALLTSADKSVHIDRASPVSGQ